MEGPRPVKPEELDSLVELLDSVFRSNSDRSMASDFPQLINEENVDHLRVISDGDKMVCHVGYVLRDVSVLGCTVTTGCLGAVAAHPGYRGKGLATHVLHDAFQCLRAEGADFVIISGGRGLYLRNGAAFVGRCYEMKMRHDYLKKFEIPAMELQHITDKEDISLAADLYEGEPVRFVRLREDWHFFLKSRKCMDGSSRLFVMRAEGVSAYAVVTEKSAEGCISVSEFAGDRRVLIGGLFELAKECGVDNVNLSIMDWDDCLLDLLIEEGCEKKEVNMPGTTRIINFPQLVERLKPRFETFMGVKEASKVYGSEKNDDLILNVGEDIFTYDAAAAAQVIFGRKDVPDVLKGALPTTIPWCGLNYI